MQGIWGELNQAHVTSQWGCNTSLCDGAVALPHAEVLSPGGCLPAVTLLWQAAAHVVPAAGTGSSHMKQPQHYKADHHTASTFLLVQ